MLFLLWEHEARQRALTLSTVTLQQHLDVFLHTYVPSRGTAKSEDFLDEPLTELCLLQYAGERRVGASGRYRTRICVPSGVEAGNFEEIV